MGAQPEAPMRALLSLAALMILPAGCREDTVVVPQAEPVMLGAPYDIDTDAMSISWTESSLKSFEYYELYRGESSGVSVEDELILYSEDPTETIFRDEGLQAYHTYFYRIWVYNTAGESAASNEVSGTTEYDTAPSAVILEEPSDVSATAMLLSWSQSQAADFGGYTLYRAETEAVDESALAIQATADQSLTDFLDTGLIPDTTYYYRVYVEDAWGIATGSNVVSATTTNTEAPWCSISRAPSTRPVGERFLFEAVDCGDTSSSVADLEVRWDFGDGDGWTTATTEKTASHAYARRGAYTVQLEVSDGQYSSVSSTTLVVTEPQLIPADDYLVGQPAGSSPWPDLEPEHQVSLSAFQIDAYETTTEAYAAFLSDGGGAAGHYSTSQAIQGQIDGSYQAVHGAEELPIVGITWYDAEAYCAWAGGALPSEAQWEAAARGPWDGPDHHYPWGDELPGSLDPVPLNYNNEVGDVVDVGSYPEGVTVWDDGVVLWDMAGNADEWVADYYDPDYYQWAIDHGDLIDPTGPATSPYGGSEPEYRVSRGGSFCNDDNPIRVYFRCYADPYQRGPHTVRCVWPTDQLVHTTAGGEHSCSLDSAGFLVCWGDDSYGQAPTPAGTYTDVDAGQAHTCAVAADGGLDCWGDDSAGQASPPRGSFTAVQAGWDHSCALAESGEIYCWGANDYGQTDTPGGSFVAVSAGDYHSCAIDTSGALQCWGMDEHGESTPPAGSFVAVSSGHFHSCAIDTDGAAHCWGSDDDGESSPPSDTWVDISAGQAHSCGVTSSGQARCWGSDYYGQASPPSGGFELVRAGGLHSCGLDADGQVQCWGRNNAGQCSVP
jgi:formylglycine-generating enzyme required for sulfatase activity